MATTNVVQEILSVPQLPANRPYERIQRIATGLFFGSFLGSLFALLFFATRLSLLGYAIPFIAAFLILGIGYGLYKATSKDVTDESIPVVAKVLGTDEAEAHRTMKTGSVAIPVVVRPLEGEDFRSIIAVNPKSKGESADLPVGSILALRQMEPGVGALIPAPANDEQKKLMKDWSKSVKMVSHRAPILPLRHGALDRVGLVPTLEFYGGMTIGIVTLIFLILTFGG